MLASQLVRIADQHRWSRDFTRPSLYRALRDVVASFQVYRTYVRPCVDEVRPEDRKRINEAVRAARPGGIAQRIQEELMSPTN